MHISYDYSDLILELKEELTAHALSPNSIIHILRETKTVVASIPTQGKRIISYNPIIDWYYGDEDRDDKYFPHLAEEEKKTFLECKKDYLAVRDKLEPITVEKCLEEMKAMSEIA